VLHDVGVEVEILAACVTHLPSTAPTPLFTLTHMVAPLQTRRKDSEKLPDFQKVDCVSVSFAPFKAAVEDQLQRLSDALVVSLRAALVGNLKTVEGCVACPSPLSPLIEGSPGFPRGVAVACLVVKGCSGAAVGSRAFSALCVALSSSYRHLPLPCTSAPVSIPPPLLPSPTNPDSW
jgi:hypothetical protein